MLIAPVGPAVGRNYGICPAITPEFVARHGQASLTGLSAGGLDKIRGPALRAPAQFSYPLIGVPAQLADGLPALPGPAEAHTLVEELTEARPLKLTRRDVPDRGTFLACPLVFILPAHAAHDRRNAGTVSLPSGISRT